MSIFVTDEDQRKAEDINGKRFLYSKFQFLGAHAGLRPGELHMLIGTSGSGKSTLARSIAIDCARNHRVLFWSSEESIKSLALSFNKLTRDKDILDNIFIYPEMTMPDQFRKKDPNLFMEFFREKTMSYFPDVIFIDNITTSHMYSDAIGWEGQGIVSGALVKYAVKNEIPIFMVAHTKKGIVDNQNQLINITDIRGNAVISMNAGYAYVLQSFKVENRMVAILHIQKHRNHKDITEKYYHMGYEDGNYVKDRPVPFSFVNEVFQLRNRLKSKFEK
jgi:ABC-type dipeptide/oligopeptide/nickel transport system ATPase component